MKQKTLTLSLCQMEIAPGNWNVNQIHARSFLSAASRQGSNLILFPEMTLTGITDDISSMSDSKGKTLISFQRLASAYEIAIGFGWGKPIKNKLENHYTIVGPDGTILSDYVKIHPFTYGGEDKYFISGNDFSIFFYRGFRICTFLCYDLRFPELYQAASKDCDLIITAANWPASRKLHWKTLCQARAIENQVYFAGCNMTGQSGDQYYSGDSALYAPDGKKLGSLSNSEGLITYTIVNDVSSIRKDFPVKNDRKISYYKSIL